MSAAFFLEITTNYEELSKKLIQCMPAHALPPQTHMPPSSVLLSQPGSPPSEPASQSAREGMASLRELSYLPQREFKVQGGQVGDQSSDINYNNVCMQIDDGIREGFTDSEIVCGVLKIIRPGIFKDKHPNPPKRKKQHRVIPRVEVYETGLERDTTTIPLSCDRPKTMHPIHIKTG